MQKIIALSVILLLFVLAFAVDATVKEIVDNPQKYDKKSVTVSGVVNNMRLRTSQAGNKYTTFLLKDGSDRVNVYSDGHLDNIKDNDKVIVKGIFEAEKKVGEYTFKNEIDASSRVGGSVKKAEQKK